MEGGSGLIGELDIDVVANPGHGTNVTWRPAGCCCRRRRRKVDKTLLVYICLAGDVIDRDRECLHQCRGT